MLFYAKCESYETKPPLLHVYISISIISLSEPALIYRSRKMNRIDEKILELMKGNARISMQALGKAIGISRVAARKHVKKLENDKIIRGYNTCIYRDDEITMFIDIVTMPDKYDDVLKKLSYMSAYIRQIFRTTKPYHIHIVAVSDCVSSLKYLTRMIQKECGSDIAEIHCHAVKEVIKDVYGKVDKYGQKSVSDGSGSNGTD